jgi:hypothetical protein
MKTAKVSVLGVVVAVGMLGVAVVAEADVLELKNGQVLTGKYMGGTAATIRFETAEGVKVIEVVQAVALTFTGTTAPAESPAVAAAVPVAPAASPAAATPAPAAAAAGSVVVPAGTVLMVRMVDGAGSRDPQGKRFATVLETDLVVNNVLVAKAGTKVYGRVEKAKQAGRLAGKSELDLRLRELTVGGTLVPIMTGAYAQAGARSIGKTAKGALAGAAVGALVDKDATGKGAAIGALASGLKPGQPIVVPPQTLLEFEIQQPVTINTAR